MSQSTTFAAFARLCERLRATSSKLEKTALLAEFLTSLSDSDLELASLFVLGKTFPDYDARVLNVSWQTLRAALAELPAAGQDSEGVTLAEIQAAFSEIAERSGPGSRKAIQEKLRALFARTNELEREYLTRIVFGEMRTGVAEGLLLEAIAKASGLPLESVRRANMYLGHPGEVARIALRHGEEGLRKLSLTLFRPVQPMLAELAEDFDKVFTEHGGQTALEFKLDGARVQIHKRGADVRIFSRHLTDVTASLPDLVERARQALAVDTAIVEGEVVAVGENGRPLPFQILMRRFRRVHDIEAVSAEVPIRLYLFDLLYLEGTSRIDLPYQERVTRLAEICPEEWLVERLVTDDPAAAEGFLQRALDQGHEGLMAKRLDSEYTPGSRGKRWFKIKPAETLDLVIVAADWGSGRREGWLSNYHLAARDEPTGKFLHLGKTFKGLTDEQFRWMTQKLQSLKVRESNYTVYVRPEVVVEVAYNEIQRSPQYDSGFALRFARIKRIREDKSPAQVDTVQRVRALYEQQFERKARSPR